MTIEISTYDVPREERLAYWREFARKLPEAVEIRAENNDVQMSMSTTSLGQAAVTSVTTDSIEFEVHRPARLIRQSDPEAYRLLINLRGRTGVAQAGADTELRDGQMAMYYTSLPLYGWRRTADRGARLLMLDIPRARLPLPSDKARRVLSLPLPNTPVSRLVTTVARQVSDDSEDYQPGDAERVSATLIDLLVIVLSNALRPGEAPPATVAAQRRTLTTRVRSFIEANLGSAELSPRMIAEAHHISLRTLYRAFRDEESCVADYIRQRRLECCRRDLADPACAGQPIRAIAARWGFADHAHLTRAFHAAYQMTPKAYRAQQQSDRVGPDPA